MTYMNDSGQSVGPALRFFKLPLSAIVVIHDEIDLAAGKLKVKTGGGDAGNNGLRSITATLGPDYRRVRIGVGHPGEKGRVHGHVLRISPRPTRTGSCRCWMRSSKRRRAWPSDDDPGFMNKVALVLNPPANKPVGERRPPGLGALPMPVAKPKPEKKDE